MPLVQQQLYFEQELQSGLFQCICFQCMCRDAAVQQQHLFADLLPAQQVRVCVCCHPIISGRRSTPFGMKWMHQPGSHRRKVTHELFIFYLIYRTHLSSCGTCL
ncbi:unnamed protein product [Pylaiella littoralis]